jgi:hypothetical protein
MNFTYSDYLDLYFVSRHHPSWNLEWTSYVEGEESIDVVTFKVYYATHDADDSGTPSDYLKIELSMPQDEPFNLQLVVDHSKKSVTWNIEEDDEVMLVDKHDEKEMIIEWLSKVLPKAITESRKFKKDFEVAAASTESQKLVKFVKGYDEPKPFECWIDVKFKGKSRSAHCKLEPWKKLGAQDSPFKTAWLAADSSKPFLRLEINMQPIDGEAHSTQIFTDIISHKDSYVILKEYYSYSYVREVLIGEMFDFVLSVIYSVREAVTERNALRYEFAKNPSMSPAAYMQLCEAVADYDYTSDPISEALEIVQFSFGKIYVRWDSKSLPDKWFKQNQRRVFSIHCYHNVQGTFRVDCPIIHWDTVPVIKEMLDKILFFFSIDGKLDSRDVLQTSDARQLIMEQAKDLDILFKEIHPGAFETLADSPTLFDSVDSEQPLAMAEPELMQQYGLFWKHDGFQSLPVLKWDPDSDHDVETFASDFAAILSDWKVPLVDKKLSKIFTKKSLGINGFKESVQKAAEEFKFAVLDVSDGESFKACFIPAKRKASVKKLIKASQAPISWVG